MPNSVIQCGNCGHETPAESIYCENCGIYLKEVVPVRPPAEWGAEVQASTLSAVVSEPSATDVSQAASLPAQSQVPPSFADVIGFNDGYFSADADDAFVGEGEDAPEVESETVLEAYGESISEENVQVKGAYEDASNNTGEPVLDGARESYPDEDGFKDYVTLDTQLPPIPTIRLIDEDRPTVDPQSPPFQPRIGAFRVAVVGVMAALFGVAVVLLFCIAVMRLLGV